ncbi:MAG: dTMP kinase [Gammaproteobacteria bacterium]
MVGRFITMEGSEGVGKSTNMAFICDYLESRGVSVEMTREPGGTPIAEAIREVVLADHDETLDPNTEVLLMFAARAVHLNNRIRPALAAGRWVVCDRFTDATFAYQGAGRGVELGWIQRLADQVHGDLWPDCTLLLDAPTAVGRQRALNRGAPDRIEQEQADFFDRVRGAYLARADAEPGRFQVIDATASLDDVQRDIGLVLDSLVEEFG